MLPDLLESRAAAAAYAALAEFERLAALPPLAPSLADRLAVADLIARRHPRYVAMIERSRRAGDPLPAMTRAAPPIDEARARVQPADWWEALTAIALCTPLTDELFAALADSVPTDSAPARSAPAESSTGAPEGEEQSAGKPGNEARATTSGDGVDEWAARQLRAALDEDPVLAARIAMWGRRLVGEAIVLAREFGGDQYPALADRLAASHRDRLAALGLTD